EISRLYVLTPSKAPPDVNNLRVFVLTSPVDRSREPGSGRRDTEASATRLGRERRRPPRRAGRAADIALVVWLKRSKPLRHFVSPMPAPVAFGCSESPGGACTHWKAPPFHGARRHRPFASIDRSAGPSTIADIDPWQRT